MLRDGRPYRAIGVNYFDCFLRFLREEENTAFEAGFATLERYRIPFARFCATGFTPRYMRLYQNRDLERLEWILDGAHKIGKPVFVGEFGALGFDQDTRRHFQNLLNTWVHSEVALAALWVFAYDRRPEYEVTASNERSYQLEAIMQANKKLREGGAPLSTSQRPGGQCHGGSAFQADPFESLTAP